MKKNSDCEISSGNIFADLGFPNPEERLAKVELVIQIKDLIKQKKLTQIEAAKLLGIDQPKISKLTKGILKGFSLERLFKFLNILGQRVTIKVTPQPKTSTRNLTVDEPRRKKKIINNLRIQKPTTTEIFAKKSEQKTQIKIDLVE
jgi:predicted XRE-type DNA-binding protein